MGAAASVQLVYSDALLWFTQYFDAGVYVQDFHNLDKDHNGGIECTELQNWLRSKASNDGASWKMVINNSEVFKIAHAKASKTSQADREKQGFLKGDDYDHAIRVVDIDEFKAFLIHLFALSIMWVHFKKADNWVEGNDVGNQQLTRDEFKLACRTFSSAQANEELSDETILEDFELLDENKDGFVDFVEVCNYCCKFLDEKFVEELFASNPKLGTLNGRTSVDLGLGETPSQRNRKGSVTATATSTNPLDSPAGENENDPVDDSNMALDVIAMEMEKNNKIAEFEEIKHTTEIAIMGGL